MMHNLHEDNDKVAAILLGFMFQLTGAVYNQFYYCVSY
jgi:hypothetical protein